MKLLTKELEATFKKYPLYSQEGLGDNATCIVKFFNPVGPQTWHITEASKEGDDWTMFGWCDLGLGDDCSEWGYVSLNELQSIRLPYGLTIERDLYAEGTVRQLRDEFSRDEEER